MPVGRRPKPNAEAPKPAAEEDDGDLIDEDPDEDEEAKPGGSGIPQPPVNRRRGELDEPVGRPGAAPGAVRFQPGFPGAGGAMPNAMPPLRPPMFAFQQAAPQYEPQRPQEPGGPPAPVRRDGAVGEEAAAATAGRETDFLVNAFVDYEDEENAGQAVSCGHLERITMTRAACPETYIPSWVGGNRFWIRLYHATAFGGQIGRPVGNGAPFSHNAMTGRPFVRGWRVNMNIEEMVRKGVAEACAAAGIPVPASLPGMAMQPAGSIPIPYAQGQVGYFQQQMADMQRRLDAAEDRARRAEDDRRMEQAVAPLRDSVHRMEAALAGGGGQNVVTQTIGALGQFMQGAMPKHGGMDDPLVQFMMKMNGPEMMIAQGNMYAGVMDAALNLAKAGRGDGTGGVLTALAPHFKGVAEKFVEGMNKRQEARDQFTMELKRREMAIQEQKAGAKAPAQQPPRPSGQPAQPAQPAQAVSPGNGQSKDRAFFAQLFEDVKTAMRSAKDAGIPADQRKTADDAGRKLALAMQIAVENGMWQRDELVYSLVKECIGDPATKMLNGDPEMFISKLCVAMDSTMEFARDMASSFRRNCALPPLVAPQAAAGKTEAPVPAPAPAPPPSAPQAPVAMAPAAGGAPTAQPVASPPTAGVAAVESAQPPAAGPPSPQVEGQHAVDAHVGEPQGPAHVVQGGPQAPAGQGVQAGDAEGKGGEPPKQDGVGLVQPPVPAAPVEKPVVP